MIIIKYTEGSNSSSRQWVNWQSPDKNSRIENKCKTFIRPSDIISLNIF